MTAEKYKPESPPVERQIPKVVLHPRFGDKVIATRCKASPEEVRASYRWIKALEVYPESALRADLSRQNYAWTNPRKFYADILLRCTSCRRRHLFFAREQQFWYEELQINVATLPKYCCECAAERRDVEAAFERYQNIRSSASLSDEQLLQRAADLVLLFQAGSFKKIEPLGELKNLLSKRRIPAEKWSALKVLLDGGKRNPQPPRC